jgi:L-aspartate oxidase
MPLLTEALRGEGAVLVDERGERFMIAEHRDAELAPRDVVARAIWKVLARGGRAYLDARDAVGAAFPERFPNVFELCQQDGLDPRIEALPVAPAAHYHMGGIAVDTRGRSSLPGLWAAGEDACTGVHGANRLASNSLLEAIVFGSAVARDIASRGGTAPTQLPLPSTVVAHEARAEATRTVASELRQLMWSDVGLVRTGESLRHALVRIDELSARLGRRSGEARNMLEVARLVALAALERRESRGAHFRAGLPRGRRRCGAAPDRGRRPCRAAPASRRHAPGDAGRAPTRATACGLRWRASRSDCRPCGR